MTCVRIEPAVSRAKVVRVIEDYLMSHQRAPQSVHPWVRFPGMALEYVFVPFQLVETVKNSGGEMGGLSKKNKMKMAWKSLLSKFPLVIKE